MSEHRSPVIVTIGNPNTGKSTLFNALTGLRQKVGNFPGVTVERLSGSMPTPSGRVFELLDIPGTYSLSANSPDEAIAVDTLLGRDPGVGQPDVVLLVLDASNLRRNLFLASQVLELGLPTVVALNMMDLARKRGVHVDVGAMSETLGCAVMPICAADGEGIGELINALETEVSASEPRQPRNLLRELAPGLDVLRAELATHGEHVNEVELARGLIDRDGVTEKRWRARFGANFESELARARELAGGGRDLATLEARARYTWIAQALSSIERRTEQGPSTSDRIDAVVNHPIIGTGIFVLLMALVFQAVFAWATPLMDVIDGAAGQLAAVIETALPPSMATRFLSEGVVDGVGSEVIFLPEILILSAFIILLEDSGYMARAAFVMDRLMRWCGLSGHSFIPMLTSFACAVPGILGTRVVANPRDRLATILAAPFMTCSARLPVYALLIAAFVPQRTLFGGLLNLQGVVLLGLYFLGIFGGILTAFLLKRTLLKGPTPTFLMEMPAYRRPRLKSVATKLYMRARVFLVRAGTLIFGVAIVVWGLSSFPRAAAVDGVPVSGSVQLEQSYLGQAGRFVEPAFRPLGWDWRVSASVLASFPAREVVIAALGTIYAVEEEDTVRLAEALGRSKHADGRPVYSLPMVLGLLVFYAFCLQCISTMAAMARETNSWKWPAFAWAYMTGLGYVCALLIFQIGTALS